MSFGLFQVSVRFGPTTALDGVTFTAPPGVVSAVVGGDGAGKTTALGCLTGAVRPARGRVERPDKRMLGVMPSPSGTWRNLTVDENVDFVAKAYGISGDGLRRKRGELLARAGLDHSRDRLAGQLSGGMRQKLGFLLAILHEPALLVLDEPTTGVDPVSRVELWGMDRRSSRRGRRGRDGDHLPRRGRAFVDSARPRLGPRACERDRRRRHPLALRDDQRRGRTDNPRRAWRRGRVYHEWHPAGEATTGPAEGKADLEDAVIAELLHRREPASSARA
jgi:ABC-2 type transport system ATP-binding protein